MGYEGTQIAMLLDWLDWFLWQFLRQVILQAIQEAFLRQLLTHAEVECKAAILFSLEGNFKCEILYGV